MDRALGPFNFNSNHEFALLVDGFDSDPLVANPHNGRWYERHYLALGLEPRMDWYAYWFDRQDIDPRVIRVANRVLSRHPGGEDPEPGPLALRSRDRAAPLDLRRRVGAQLGPRQDGARGVRAPRARASRAFLDPKLCFIVEIGGKAVGLSINLPDMNQVVKKMNGSVLPVRLVALPAAQAHDQPGCGSSCSV